MGGFILTLLLILFLIVISIFSMGVSLLRGLFNLLTGRQTSFGQQDRQNGNPFFGRDKEENYSEGRKEHGEKVFGKDEGEYVDFEEYKDE